MIESSDTMQEFEISAEQAGQRLDKALSLLYPALSRSFFQKLIKEGQIKVNEVVRKANYCVDEGDLLSVVIPKAQENIHFAGKYCFRYPI